MARNRNATVGKEKNKGKEEKQLTQRAAALLLDTMQDGAVVGSDGGGNSAKQTAGNGECQGAVEGRVGSEWQRSGSFSTQDQLWGEPRFVAFTSRQLVAPPHSYVIRKHASDSVAQRLVQPLSNCFRGCVLAPSHFFPYNFLLPPLHPLSLSLRLPYSPIFVLCLSIFPSAFQTFTCAIFLSVFPVTPFLVLPFCFSLSLLHFLFLFTSRSRLSLSSDRLRSQCYRSSGV